MVLRSLIFTLGGLVVTCLPLDPNDGFLRAIENPQHDFFQRESKTFGSTS
jgi:hypothetical protein